MRARRSSSTLLILGLTFSVGCGPSVDDGHPATTATVADTTVKLDEAESKEVIANLPARQLGGHWVTAAYLDHLDRSRSPREADRRTTNLTTLSIDARSDTLWVTPVPMCATEWEQDRGFLRQQDGTFKEFGRRYSGDPIGPCREHCETLQIYAEAGEIRLVLTSPSRPALSVPYSLMSDAGSFEEPHQALAALARERFIAGTYRDAEGAQVEFGRDGVVTGLPDATQYTVSTYFCEEMSMYNTDIVILSQADTSNALLPHGDIYVAKWDNDFLLLYGIGWPEDYDRDHPEVRIPDVPDLQLTFQVQ